MCKICLAAVGLVLMLGSISHGAQPMQDQGFQIAGDVWNVPTPSGLRFSGPSVSVRTANIEGGTGAPCMACGGLGMACGGMGNCVHWTMVPWYAPWPDDGYGSGHGHGRCCVRRQGCGPGF